MATGTLRVAVDTEGSAWMVDAEARIWKRSGDQWQAIQGAAVEVAAGADGSVWVLGADVVPGGFGVYRWTGQTWERDPPPNAVARISVAPDGTLWAVNSVREIWRRGANGGWARVAGAAVDISAGVDGSVWAIGEDQSGRDFGIWRFAGDHWDREPVPSAGMTVAVSDRGEPWITNANEEIWRRVQGGWQRMPGAALRVSADARGGIWVIGTNPLPGGFGVYRWASDTWVSEEGPPTQTNAGFEGMLLASRVSDCAWAVAANAAAGATRGGGWRGAVAWGAAGFAASADCRQLVQERFGTDHPSPQSVDHIDRGQDHQNAAGEKHERNEREGRVIG
jgi:hypothetical protein